MIIFENVLEYGEGKKFLELKFDFLSDIDEIS